MHKIHEGKRVEVENKTKAAWICQLLKMYAPK
jgi:hypothetical protein